MKYLTLADWDKLGKWQQAEIAKAVETAFNKQFQSAMDKEKPWPAIPMRHMKPTEPVQYITANMVRDSVYRIAIKRGKYTPEFLR